jgi:hypothetical protein
MTNKKRNLPPWPGRFLLVVPGPLIGAKARSENFVTTTVATAKSVGRIFRPRARVRKRSYFFFVVFFVDFLVAFFFLAIR